MISASRFSFSLAYHCDGRWFCPRCSACISHGRKRFAGFQTDNALCMRIVCTPKSFFAIHALLLSAFFRIIISGNYFPSRSEIVSVVSIHELELCNQKAFKIGGFILRQVVSKNFCEDIFPSEVIYCLSHGAFLTVSFTVPPPSLWIIGSNSNVELPIWKLLCVHAVGAIANFHRHLSFF